MAEACKEAARERLHAPPAVGERAVEIEQNGGGAGHGRRSYRAAGPPNSRAPATGRRQRATRRYSRRAARPLVMIPVWPLVPTSIIRRSGTLRTTSSSSG